MASNAPNTARIRTIQTSPIFSKVISCCCRSLASRATPRPESTCGRFAVSTLMMPPCENATNPQLSTEETKKMVRLAAHSLTILPDHRLLVKLGQVERDSRGGKVGPVVFHRQRFERAIGVHRLNNAGDFGQERRSILRAGFVNSSGQILEEDWIAQLLERLAIGNRTQTGRLGGQDSIQPDAIAER